MNIYEQVRALKPRRSVFNLSYEKKLTCDMGQLIPIMCDEVVPGDTWRIGVEAVLRFMPMMTPILHEINVFFHYYFVPYRILSTDWEAFITGGVDGADAHVMPTWIPTHADVVNQNGVTVKDNGVHSLWDYFGFPVTDAGVSCIGVYPISWPLRAYNQIYNDYYRDETHTAKVDLADLRVKQRCWEKDYFTSALPWQQRGTAPSLPLSGTTNAVFSSSAFPSGVYPGSSNPLHVNIGGADAEIYAGNATGATNLKNALDRNAVSFSAAGTFNVSDLRLAFQIQKWMERNARAGVRYKEFLLAHFGVSFRDDRAQRAEYIGGTKMPVIISEVLQTSATGTTPQGTMAGHGIVAGRDFCAKYTATEFGCIVGIMSIMPRTTYEQGVDRQWLRGTRYDYYSPEWAHLSEQKVYKGELYATSTESDNIASFGYQGRFNELRAKKNICCGLMRYGVTGTLGKYWTVSRVFPSLPSLNESFLLCIPRKDFLADTAQPTCIVNIANIVKAIRPLPVEADPGLIDHA